MAGRGENIGRTGLSRRARFGPRERRRPSGNRRRDTRRSRFGRTLRRVLPGGPVSNEVVIADCVADRLFTIESVSGPTPFRYRYSLEPAGEKTRLHLEGQITGEGLLGPLAHVDLLTTQLFKHGMGENLRKLGELIELS